ncbi:MAG: diaminopimelate epimerase [Prevotella sp.]
MTHQTIKFTKMHGAGNDYIYVNTLLYNISDPERLSEKWSAYHTGIGSDGLVLIGRPSSDEADFSMRIFNADGSEAMMCGNASRCIGKYLYDKGLVDKTSVRLETLSGVKELDLNVVDGKVETVRVDMLEPRFDVADQYQPQSKDAAEDIIHTETGDYKGTFVSMGNPHFVIFVDEIQNVNVAETGKLLETHKAFPGRCNIEFAQILPNGEIRTRVWERGSGITMACGTGACATAVAAAKTGRAGNKSSIVMDGGTLSIEWSKANNHVYMTGGAEFVFEGEIVV